MTRPDDVSAVPAPDRVRVLLVHWRRIGSGPRFSLDQARALAEAPALDLSVSYASNGELAAEWESLGLDSFSFRTYDNRRQLLLGIPRLIARSVQLRRFIRQHRIQVVYSSMYSVWQSIGLPIYLPRHVKFIASVHDLREHSGNQHWLRAWSVRRELDRADGVVTYSTAVTAGIRALVRPGLAVHQSHLGVTVTPAEPRELRDREQVVGLFGWLVAYKGLDLFLDALLILRSRGVRVRGLVAGSGTVERDVITATADYVDWDLRWIPEDEVGSVLEKFDVLALPYVDGSQSAALTRGLSVGLPVVATPVGGLPEQVEVSQAGLVADAVTAEAFADAVERMLHDPVAYAQFSANAIASSHATLSWGNAASGLAALFAQTAMGSK